MEKKYDASLTGREVGLIEKIVEKSLSKKKLVSKKELERALG